MTGPLATPQQTFLDALARHDKWAESIARKDRKMAGGEDATRALVEAEEVLATPLGLSSVAFHDQFVGYRRDALCDPVEALHRMLG